MDLNPWQFGRQVIYLLSPSVLRWPNGNQEAVFARVRGAPVDPSFFTDDARGAYALVHPVAERSHARQPYAIVEEARVAVAIFASVANDQAGSSSTYGGSRTRGIGATPGRGVKEIVTAVRAALATAGLGVRARPASESPVDALDAPGSLARVVLEVSAFRLPSALVYPNHARMKVTSPGAGQATVTWLPGPARFDGYGIYLGRAAGAVAPAAGAGTALVAVAGADPGTYVDAPGAGQWSYGLYRAFTEHQPPTTPGTVDAYSTGLRATITV